jgi:hypothetical protein
VGIRAADVGITAYHRRPLEIGRYLIYHNTPGDWIGWSLEGRSPLHGRDNEWQAFVLLFEPKNPHEHNKHLRKLSSVESP